MDKKEALRAILEQDLIYDCWNPDFEFTADQLLNIISKKNYCISRELGVHSRKVTKVLDYIYPDRLKTGGAQLCKYILSTYGLKCCTGCMLVYNLLSFSKDKHSSDGLNIYCNKCLMSKSRRFRVENPEKSKEHSRSNYYAHKADFIHRVILRKSSISKATPSWANLDKIKEVYRNRPQGMHVDHIVPLSGDLVCGLHVHNNLQYLSPDENIRKSNNYDPMAE